MSNREPGIGLDVGTAFLVKAEQAGGTVSFIKERDAFFSISMDYDPTEILDKAGATYIVDKDDNQVYIVGEDAMQFAKTFSGELRRPLKGGVISNQDREAIPVLTSIIRAIVGDAQYPGESLHYTVPAKPLNADFDIVFHQNILNNILSGLGYEPQPINEAQCIAYAELVQNRLTGITISFGSGMSNFCLSVMGIPAITFSLVGGGDSIDEGAQKAVVGYTKAKITARKEQGINILNPTPGDDVEMALSIYYKNLIDNIVKGFANAVNNAEKLPSFDDGVPVVIAGGTSLAGGFVEYFKESMSKIKLPFEVGEIRHAKNPLYTVSEGALRASLMSEKKKNRQ